MKKQLLCLMAAGSMFAMACNNSDTGDGKTDNNAASTTEAAKDANDKNSAVDDNTNDFFMKAAKGGMMEVEAGKTAQTNAASADVKNFGSRMVTDHTKANDELKAIAAAKNVTLPAVLEGDHREHLNDLGKKTGNDFDKAYMDMMVDDHDKTVNMFEDAANNSKDADVKAFAAKTLPVLREHQQMAKDLNAKVKQLKK
jgi:putative membrane protein